MQALLQSPEWRYLPELAFLNWYNYIMEYRKLHQARLIFNISSSSGGLSESGFSRELVRTEIPAGFKALEQEDQLQLLSSLSV
jgi:hypothetical protein